jgi:hypothetical protein
VYNWSVTNQACQDPWIYRITITYQKKAKREHKKLKFYWSNTDGKVGKRLVGFDPRVRQTFQAKKLPVSINNCE